MGLATAISLNIDTRICSKIVEMTEPVDASAMMCAVSKGRLAHVRWLVESGVRECPVVSPLEQSVLVSEIRRLYRKHLKHHLPKNLAQIVLDGLDLVFAHLFRVVTNKDAR
jgi:hypothetical protein